jgi:hypothetical protein
MNSNMKKRLTERDALRQNIERAVVSNPAYAAAYFTGSIGRGAEDEWSDLDIWIIVRDEAIDAIKQSVSTIVAQIGEVVLIEEAPQNAPQGGAYLLVLYKGEFGAHQIDWYWQALSQANRPTTSRLIFDNVGLPVAEDAQPNTVRSLEYAKHRLEFVWAMINIAAKKIARRQHWDVVRMIQSIREALAEIGWHIGERDTIPTYREAATWNDRIPTTSQEQIAYLYHLTRIARNCSHSIPDANPIIDQQTETFLNFVEKYLVDSGD